MLLWERCSTFGITPSEKLFPGLQCPVTKDLIDFWVQYAVRPDKEKEKWQLAALAGGNPIKNLR